MENPITSRYGTSHQRANLPRRENRVQPPIFVSALIENKALTSHENRLTVPIFRRTHLHHGLLALLLAFVSHLVAGAQQPVERERKMWDLNLIELAEKNHSDSTTTPGDNSKPVYESLDGPTETVNEGRFDHWHYDLALTPVRAKRRGQIHCSRAGAGRELDTGACQP